MPKDKLKCVGREIQLEAEILVGFVPKYLNPDRCLGRAQS